jgi:Na+/H+-translocating membrane pyrophosphatase
MNILELLKLNVQYHHMSLLNFFYLVFLDTSNQWYIAGFLISFALIYMLKVAVQHQIRVAKETKRTGLEEVISDSYKEKANGIISVCSYFLFLISLIIIVFYTTWNFPYTHLLLLLSLSVLVTQFTTVYYERKLLWKIAMKPAFDKWKKKKKN